MSKPNSKSTLKEIRAYVREKRLNKPEIKLTMNKPELVAGLKKHGHWDHKGDAKEKLKAGGKKPPMTKKPKAKPKKKVETAEEAYKRHFREFNNPKKYPDAKLKEFLENIKNRPKSYYKDNESLENSDKGAVRAITQILRTRNPKRDYRRVDPSLFKPRKGDLVLKS